MASGSAANVTLRALGVGELKGLAEYSEGLRPFINGSSAVVSEVVALTASEVEWSGGSGANRLRLILARLGEVKLFRLLMFRFAKAELGGTDAGALTKDSSDWLLFRVVGDRDDNDVAAVVKDGKNVEKLLDETENKGLGNCVRLFVIAGNGAWWVLGELENRGLGEEGVQALIMGGSDRL